MTIDDRIKEIKDKHKGDFLSLWRIYSCKQRFVKSIQLWGSIILSLFCFIILLFFSNEEVTNILDKLVGNILSVLPNILGFTLTGYVLLIGFGSNEFMETITEQNDSGFSFFQHFSSIFSWSIIIQAVTLVSSFIISLVSDLKLKSNHALEINNSVLIVIMFLSFYSLLLIIRLVLNVFSFGQIVQYHYSEKKLIKELNSENTNGTNSRNNIT